jgi:hypothetical protein
MSTFASTLSPPLAIFPSLNPSSIPYSFTLPSTTLSSQAYSSSSSSQPSSSRLPRGPNPRSSRRQQQHEHDLRHRQQRGSRGEGAGVRSRALGASGGGGARTGTSGLERALVGRLGWGMDLSREERDLSEDEEEDRERVRLAFKYRLNEAACTDDSNRTSIDVGKRHSGVRQLLPHPFRLFKDQRRDPSHRASPVFHSFTASYI